MKNKKLIRKITNRISKQYSMSWRERREFKFELNKITYEELIWYKDVDYLWIESIFSFCNSRKGSEYWLNIKRRND